MPPVPRLRLAAIVLLGAGTLVSGCFPASCETTPFAGTVVAQVGAPVTDLPGLALAACKRVVTFDSVDYELTSSDWQTPDAALTEIGEITDANLAAGAIEDRRVYRIEGIDPAEGIAMRVGVGNAPTLLLPEFLPMPAAACRYLPPEERDACLAAVP